MLKCVIIVAEQKRKLQKNSSHKQEFFLLCRKQYIVKCEVFVKYLTEAIPYLVVPPREQQMSYKQKGINPFINTMS